jgi:hypothetical protein
MNPRHGILLGTLLLFGACGRSPGDDEDTAAAAANKPALAPAIIRPEEEAGPAEPPSYEVAIAAAAAEHNRAQDRCAQQPEAVRAQCDQEANAAFDETRRKLEDLRGNQP